MREASDTSHRKRTTSPLAQHSTQEARVPSTTVSLRPVSNRGPVPIEETKPPTTLSDHQTPLEPSRDKDQLSPPGTPPASISQPPSAPLSPASSSGEHSHGTDCSWEANSSRHTALSRPTSGPAAFVQRRLSRKKQEILEELMVMLEECLETKIQELEEAFDSEGGPPGHGMPPSRQNGGGHGSTGRASGNKRRLDGGDQEGSSAQEGEDDEDGQRRDSKRAKKQLNLACPYFKRDPERFRGKKHQSCATGWDKYHRVKEHVIRHHAQPKFCFRCREPFKDTKVLEGHMRQTPPCPVVNRDVSNIDPTEGYTEEQKVKLQGRKTRDSERRKWEEMYCLLFNLNIETDLAQVPDPYCDDGDGHASFQSTVATYLRRELPRVAQPILAREIDDGVEGVKDIISKKIPSIVSSILDGMLHNLRSGQSVGGQGAGRGLGPVTQAMQPAVEVSGLPQIPVVPQSTQGLGTSDLLPGLPGLDFNADWDGWQASFPHYSMLTLPASPSDGTCSGYLTESRSNNTSPHSSPRRVPAEPASLNALQPMPPSQEKQLAGISAFEGDWEAYLAGQALTELV